MKNSFMLIDSNVLITPYRQYYAFDLAPSFWTQLRVLIEQGTIGILDKVKDEIMASSIKDTLAKWFNELQPPRYIRHEKQEIIMMYSKVLMSIVENPSYQEEAELAWASKTVADPWIIATASALNVPLVTTERSAKPNPESPSKNPKVPDIASDFGVEVIDVFEMMRRLGIRL